MKDIFKGKQFKKDIIMTAISYYYRFPLSYRNIYEILNQRGILVHASTIMRWVHQYGDVLYNKWKKQNKMRIKSWRLDETYIKIKGVWHYLYRAIDKQGFTLDILLRKNRDTYSAKLFLKNLLDSYGEPRTIVTDKAPSLKKAIEVLKKIGELKDTNHLRIKYMNNIIEQDHRRVKQQFLNSQSYKSISKATSTIKGIEVIHALYKEKRNENIHSVFSAYEAIKNLLLKTA